jgi:hypothetical protein
MSKKAVTGVVPSVVGSGDPEAVTPAQMSAAVAKIPTIQSNAFAVGESFLKGGISREGVGRSVEHWFSVVVMSWV